MSTRTELVEKFQKIQPKERVMVTVTLTGFWTILLCSLKWLIAIHRIQVGRGNARERTNIGNSTDHEEINMGNETIELFKTKMNQQVEDDMLLE